MFHKVMLVVVLTISLIGMLWNKISLGEWLIIFMLYLGFQCLIEKKDK